MTKEKLLKIFEKYGLSLTLQKDNGESIAFRGFIQPLKSNSNEKRNPYFSAGGKLNSNEFVLFCPPDITLSGEEMKDFILLNGEKFIVKKQYKVYFCDDCFYYWGVLIKTGEGTFHA